MSIREKVIPPHFWFERFDIGLSPETHSTLYPRARRVFVRIAVFLGLYFAEPVFILFKNILVPQYFFDQQSPFSDLVPFIRSTDKNMCTARFRS